MHTGVLTLDVEDWEHANFSQLESKRNEIAESVRTRQYRMDKNTDLWIELLAVYRAKSTCFVLGDFAARYPDAVKRLASAGHEIATHGSTHDLVYQMKQVAFREFLKRGLGTLGDLLGKMPIGFRAPSWSVDHRTPWLCEELAAQGIQYDSSQFPVRTPLFGSSGGTLQVSREGKILRIPVTVLTVGPLRLPFSSGAFFRLAPKPLIHFGLKVAARKDLPVMVVLHPREFDAHHPKLPLQGWESWVHYAKLDSTVPKLQSILSTFRWTSIQDRYGSLLDTSGARLDN